MPELPEVETVRTGIEPVLLGQRIAKADIRRADLRWPFPARMAERLTGATITALTRRSKYILATLDTHEVWLIHLGMSGRISVQGAAVGRFHHPIVPLETHDHVVIDMESGARLVYNDPRRFGAMDLIPVAGIGTHRLLRDIGPEPLGNAFHTAHLKEAFRGRRTPAKSALLDQKIVAGLGNIYVCEALWRAGISPQRHAGRISEPRLGRLVVAIRDVLSEAIAAGGSSLRDYRQADGELGYFQHGFSVYDQEEKPCKTVDCKGKIRRITQSGRSTYYCPTCQR